MGGIIAALIGILMTVGGFLAGRKMRQVAKVNEARSNEAKGAGQVKLAGKYKGEALAGRWMAGVTWLLVGGGVAIFLATTIVTVPTRNLGVTTAFGRTTDTLPNGLHVVWPWESVTIYDATVQTPEADKLPNFDVRIANEAVATMRVSLEWQLQEGVDITQLHMDWRGFDSLESRVVNTRLADALNKTFKTFDPLLSLRQTAGAPQTVASLEAVVREKLQADLPAGIIIRRLQIPFVQYPAAVQKALDDMQKELAATQVALQQEKTAESQKRALETLASAKLSPEAFLQQCLVMTERLAQAGHKISEAWTCVQGQVPITVAAK